MDANTKMPTRTKSVEMNKIVTKFICITSSVNPEALKLEEAATGGVQQKGVLENFAKLTAKHLCPSRTHVFSCQFYEIFENTFFTERFRVTPFDE